MASFPRRLASLRNALHCSGAGPKAQELDEVCAFARLVTRVPALVVDGKRLECLDARRALDELRFTQPRIVAATCAAEVVAKLLRCEPPEPALATARSALPVVVARGADQLSLTTGQGALRNDPTQVRDRRRKHFASMAATQHTHSSHVTSTATARDAIRAPSHPFASRAGVAALASSKGPQRGGQVDFEAVLPALC